VEEAQKTNSAATTAALFFSEAMNALHYAASVVFDTKGNNGGIACIQVKRR